MFTEPLEALPKGKGPKYQMFVWAHTLPDVELRSTPAVIPCYMPGELLCWVGVLPSLGKGAVARPQDNSTPLVKGKT